MAAGFAPDVPAALPLPDPGIPRLFHHSCRWLLQFVEKLLRSFSHRLKGDTVRPAGIAIGVNRAGKGVWLTPSLP